MYWKSKRNWDLDQDQVHQIPDLIPMITEDHATPPPILHVVSDDESDGYYIGSPQLSYETPFRDNEPPDRPILPELPPQQSS